jgi:hypothetical protein
MKTEDLTPHPRRTEMSSLGFVNALADFTNA